MLNFWDEVEKYFSLRLDLVEDGLRYDGYFSFGFLLFSLASYIVIMKIYRIVKRKDKK